MVWKWPTGKSKTFLETTVIPNSSNIRLIRIIKSHDNPVHYQYWKELEETTLFHHNFWSQNNHLHFKKLAQNTDTEAEFYKQFTELRARDFNEYHKETWKKNWRLVCTGYFCIFQSLKQRIITKKYSAGRGIA